MSDSSGVPSALGIEGVEWLAEGRENLTVRVTGRWRRRRPTWSGQPLLVIEAQGRRHRFPAMPEPPSLTGTAPGTWRMSFSVPASLAPHIGSRGWLQLGAVVVPLPIEVRPSIPAEPADPGTTAARQPQTTELAVQAARRRAAEVEEAAAELALRVQQLEGELEQARLQSTRQEGLQTDLRRAALAVQQREHAERARREELQDELARRIREHEEAQGVAARRLSELRSEVAVLTRQRDEAEQAAGAARCARGSAQRELAQLTRALRSGPGRGEAARAEIELASRTPRAAAGPVQTRRLPAGEQRLLGTERELVAHRSLRAARTSAAVAEELRREVAAGTMAEKELRTVADSERAARREADAKIARLEHELRESASGNERVYEAIEELRQLLDAVREAMTVKDAPPDTSGARPDTPGAPADNSGAPADTSGAPPDTSGAPPDTPAGPVDAARLEAALSRLRETTPESSYAVVAAGSFAPTAVKPWLGPVFREMVKRDADAAGRLAAAMLPAQSLVHPLPLAYDLVLSELGCVAVTSARGEVLVELRDSARDREQTQLLVSGELAGLGRLLGSRRVTRRVRGRLSRARGDRAALRALRALVRAPLSLDQLHAAGVRLDPALTLRLVSLMVRPEWTTGEDFMLAHQEDGAAAPGAALRVYDKATVSVGGAVDLRPGSTTIVCPPGSLLAVLAGVAQADVLIQGDARPLALLQSWLKRAQSG